MKNISHKATELVFSLRPILLGLFALATLFLAWQASQLKIDAGFEKQLPLDHPYMETYKQYQKDFGGANRLLIALRAKEGDIFTADFFQKLEEATDDVFFLPGVDRAHVKSIFTPNVRFIEVVEGGFSGGDVIPADFEPTDEMLDKVRTNILKSGQVGRLVSEDFTAAIISAQLLDRNETGEKLDYLKFAKLLETEIREQYQSDTIDVHIIGFAKVVGDVADGAIGVLWFFGLAVLITAILIHIYCRSYRLTGIMLACSLVAVIWQMGLLVTFGFGIDPMSILVPFLILAIAVSHGMQMVNAIGSEIYLGQNCFNACKGAFRRLFVPGSVALITDTVGFLTILLIKIPMIQELAITASLGVAVIIFTNIFMLPLLISYGDLGNRQNYQKHLHQQAQTKEKFWAVLSKFATVKYAVPTLLVAILIWTAGIYLAQGLTIGDKQAGVPELRPDSRYNLDTAEVTKRFAIGVDIIQTIAEAKPDGCIDYPTMQTIDRYEWKIRNLSGVQSTISMASAMKITNAGWNEGALKWRVLSRDSQVLVSAVRPIDTSTGLLNTDCSAMPIIIFTKDHRAETIQSIIEETEKFTAENPDSPIKLRLATGNVGVMAATNQAVEASQFPMLLWVYGAVITLCLLTFRSVTATLCTVIPLTLVSTLCYALMAQLDIGLKVSTLPVAALGVGIGVDYGIYIFTRLKRHLEEGEPLEFAFRHTLQETGSAVVFTGITLAIGVSTWIFSALQFQADMGILLTFMFLLNMIGAIIILPALAALLYPITNKFSKLVRSENG